MIDREHGGCYWKADVERGVIEPQNLLYGQSTASYALVKYYRASRLADALEDAHSLFETAQQKFHDEVHGGWIEHCERDFTPLTCTGDRIPGMPDIVGYQSGDAILHWMEAVTELHAEAPDTYGR